MKTIKIKGNEYIMVNERLKYFRSNFDGYSLRSEIVKIDEKVCIIKAVIRDNQDRIVAEGTAYEYANSTYINKTSYVENCETSAWGRALGNLGIGIDKNVASADEVLNAISQDKVKQVFGGEEIKQTTIDELKVKLEEYLLEYETDNNKKAVDYIKTALTSIDYETVYGALYTIEEKRGGKR